MKSRKKIRKICYFAALPAFLLAILLQVTDRIFPEGIPLMSKPANAGEKPPASPERTMPPARSGEIAVQEEYEIARRRGTAEALELFIARHPDSALAERARAELRQMKR